MTNSNRSGTKVTPDGGSQVSATNRLDEWIEWLQSSRARVDLASALAAGYGLSVMGLVLLNITFLRRLNPLDLSDVAQLVLRVTIPYLVAALVIHYLWIKPLRRVLPSWLMIACLGSLLVVISTGVWSFYTKAVASNAPLLQTLPDFIGDKAKDGLAVFVALSLLTLPITASVYYMGSIVRAFRRWQNGPQPPSILSSYEPGERGL